MLNMLFFLEASTETTTELPAWVAIAIAILAGITTAIKKYNAVKKDGIKPGATVEETVVYLFGKYLASEVFDDKAIAELNELENKKDITFDEYVKRLKSTTIKKVYDYILDNNVGNIKSILPTTDGLLDAVSDVVTNMIDAKYDEEAFKVLYDTFKDIVPDKSKETDPDNKDVEDDNKKN